MIKITIPKLGLTMENATLSEWKYKSGDDVKKEDILLIIETDKVSFEVPSPADGIIHPVATEGETYDVGEIVGYLLEDRKEYEQIIKQYPSEITASALETEGPEEGGLAVETATPLSPTAPRPDGRIKASPLARAMAASHNLDLSVIKGSGPGGRIIRVDILRAMEEGPAVSEKERIKRSGILDKNSIEKDVLETIPIKGIRRAIFENMYMSLSQSAQLTLHTEADAGALVRLRERLTATGHKVSYNAILTKITAMALRLHPKINSTVERDVIEVWKQVHIGLAMESNDALIVPVTRNPDLKSIREIDQEIAELIRKTRENQLSPDDLANGTFTISSLGFADIDHFTPIIRPPESAILGLGRIINKPVVKGDQVVPGKRMGLSLTFDHRIIDGAPAARFLKTIKDMIEEPLLMIS